MPTSSRDLLAALNHTRAATALLEKLLKEGISADPDEQTPAWKRASGRLTDAGIAAMRQMFASGAKDADIARKLGISGTAVHNQRRSLAPKKTAADLDALLSSPSSGRPRRSLNSRQTA